MIHWIGNLLSITRQKKNTKLQWQVKDFRTENTNNTFPDHRTQDPTRPYDLLTNEAVIHCRRALLGIGSRDLPVLTSDKSDRIVYFMSWEFLFYIITAY